VSGGGPQRTSDKSSPQLLCLVSAYACSVGKSTFLKILTGSLGLHSGEMRVGETVRFGYYDQMGLVLTAEQQRQPVLKFVQVSFFYVVNLSLAEDMTLHINH